MFVKCISSPQDWLDKLVSVALTGGKIKFFSRNLPKLVKFPGEFICADPDLMIRFDSPKKTEADPPALK